MDTPSHLASELDRVASDITAAANEYKQDARAEAEAEVAYKLAFARALLSVASKKHADGRAYTLDERKSEAEIVCEAQLRDREIKAGIAKGGKAAFDACRDCLSALQTRASLLKSEVALSGGVQPKW